MSERQARDLKHVYNAFGNDEAKWEHEVDAIMKCRAGNVEGFNGMGLRADLESEVKVCPIKGTTCLNQCVPSPATNVAGTIIARNFPEKCSVCGQEPTCGDFEIV